MDLIKRVGIVLVALIGPAMALALGLIVETSDRITVRIDGHVREVEHPTTAGQIVATEPKPPRAGDLLDVEGKVLKKHGGGQPAIWMNGERTVAGRVIPPNARLSWAHGRNRTEEIDMRRKILRPLPTSGSQKIGGPVPLIRSGRDRLVNESFGKVSGKVLYRKPILTPLAAPKPGATEAAIPSLPKVVALTFDDGPSIHTPRLLDALARENVKATFFVIAKQTASRPGVMKRMIADGHNVGHHGWQHYDLNEMGGAELDMEFAESAKLFERLGVQPRWFRPPYGRVNAGVYPRVPAAGMDLVLWDVDPGDWRKPSPQQIATDVTNNIEAGSIVLLHDGGGDRSRTVAAIPLIVKTMRARGYRFVTLDEMLTPPRTPVPTTAQSK